MTMPPRDMIESVLTDAVLPSMLGAGIVMVIILLLGEYLGRKLGPLAAGLGLLVGLTVGNYFSDGTIGYFKESPKRIWSGSGTTTPETTVRYTTVTTYKGLKPTREKKLQITLPDAGYQWLPWAATILMLHGVLARSPGMPGYVSVILRIEATILATFMLFPSDWLLVHSRLMILFMVVSFTQWQMLDRLTFQRPGWGYALSMSFLLAAGGFLAAYQFMTLFYWCVVLSSCWFIMAIVSGWPKADMGGPLGATIVLFNGILLNDAYNNFSSNPGKYDPYWILGLAGLLWAVPLILRQLVKRGWIIEVVQLMLIVAAIMAALGWHLSDVNVDMPWDGL